MNNKIEVGTSAHITTSHRINALQVASHGDLAGSPTVWLWAQTAALRNLCVGSLSAWTALPMTLGISWDLRPSEPVLPSARFWVLDSV